MTTMYIFLLFIYFKLLSFLLPAPQTGLGAVRARWTAGWAPWSPPPCGTRPPPAPGGWPPARPRAPPWSWARSERSVFVWVV